MIKHVERNLSGALQISDLPAIQLAPKSHGTASGKDFEHTFFIQKFPFDITTDKAITGALSSV